MVKNFNKETFPEIDYNSYIKELVKAINLKKSIPVGSLYDKKKAKHNGDYIDKYFFREEEFKKNFEEFRDVNPAELMGVYIFSEQKADKIKPVYIGISRDLRRRMADHLIRKNKESATWANLMKLEKPLIENYPKDKNLKVYFHRIEEDKNFELHLAEILLVLHFKPYWNSFKTH